MKTIILALVILNVAIYSYCIHRDYFGNNNGHECKWKLCPYKGIKEVDHKAAVLSYVGNDSEGTDGYCIDMLHLDNPTLEYDQLDSLLFTSHN